MAKRTNHSQAELKGAVLRRKFSHSIRLKFPKDSERHTTSPANARWMLRGKPTSPFSKAELTELADWANK